MILVPALIAVLLQATPPTPAPRPREGALSDPREPRLERHKDEGPGCARHASGEGLRLQRVPGGAAPLVLNRQEWLKTSEHYTLLGFAIRHLAARQFGNVAVVRLQPYRHAVAGTTLDRSGEFAVVDVWTKDGNSWKLSSRHLSRPDTLTR